VVFPEEKVAEVCAWKPDQAAQELERGRSGDLGALVAFTVRAIFRGFKRRGASSPTAVEMTKAAVRVMDFKPRLVP
jgi:hypothetical protein